jgi:hypothetical protein
MMVLEEDTRRCTRCRKVKSIIEFDEKSTDEHYKSCSKCLDYEREYKHRRNKEVTKKNKRTRDLKRLYNLSLEEYEKMVALQGGKCYICQRDKKLVVDHNHLTNKVRSLLCDKCNRGLGFFDEDIGFLIGAIEYLQLHKG